MDVGGGLLYCLGNNRIFAEVRFSAGFVNFYKTSENLPPPLIGKKNDVYNISIGYTYRINKKKVTFI